MGSPSPSGPRTVSLAQVRGLRGDLRASSARDFGSLLFMVYPESPGGGRVGVMREFLDEARARGFVGRGEELASFNQALLGSSVRRVLFLYGPGGIGKSTLLDAFARQARLAHRRPVYLDAREVTCAPADVSAVIAEQAARTGYRPGVAPDVLLIDGYELFAPLDRWFREELVPARPRGSVTVLAGRDAPSAGWRLDPGWRELVWVHELAGLDRAESDTLLSLLGVSEDAREAMSRLGRGHPLVLALLAEAARGGLAVADISDAPDVVGQLCRMILDDIPDAAHRAGLATCAHATRMTEDLLRHAIGVRAEEVWGWLQSRPYVRPGTVGLFLHDVVREIFEAELMHRTPDAYVTLHQTVRGYFLQRLADPAEPHSDRAAAELLLLHRRGPLAAQTAGLRDGGLLPVTRTGADDAEVFGLIERGEGSAAASLARRWVREESASLYRARSEGGVEGFAMQVYLPCSPDLAADDPVAGAVLGAVDQHGPLRPGERINVNRFAGASPHYQRDPLQLFVNGVSCILEWANQPAAWTFIVTIDPEFYDAYFRYLGLRPMVHVQEARHEIVGYGWDRRRFPTPLLFELMARRELSGELGPPPAELLRPAPLSRAAFSDAVRKALPQVSRPDRLADSPLLGSAIIEPAAGGQTEQLRIVLLAAIVALGHERRGAEHRRVLERTYLKGARSQEDAAELLDLPFSTYRRHLGQAHDRLVEVLWSVEIGERQLSDLAPP